MSVQLARDGYIGRQHAGGLYVLGKGDRYIIAVTQYPVSRCRRTDRLGTDHIFDDGKGLGLVANLLFGSRSADGDCAYLVGAVGVVLVGHRDGEAEMLGMRHRVVTFFVTHGDTLAPCAERTPFAFAAFVLQADAVERTVIRQQAAYLAAQFHRVPTKNRLGLGVEERVIEREVDVRAGIAVADGEPFLRASGRVAVADELQTDTVVAHHLGVGLIDTQGYEGRVACRQCIGDTFGGKRRAVDLKDCA